MENLRKEKRIKELIEILGLKPHVEGGYFVEMYKSPVEVEVKGKIKPAITAIYYLLFKSDKPETSVSKLHRVKWDEIWHYYEGDPLELIWIEEGCLKRQILGLVDKTQRTFAVVPANCWQAARTLGDYTLVGCVVAPGFSYEDFELFESSDSEKRKKLIKRYPEIAKFL